MEERFLGELDLNRSAEAAPGKLFAEPPIKSGRQFALGEFIDKPDTQAPPATPATTATPRVPPTAIPKPKSAIRWLRWVLLAVSVIFVALLFSLVILLRYEGSTATPEASPVFSTPTPTPTLTASPTLKPTAAPTSTIAASPTPVSTTALLLSHWADLFSSAPLLPWWAYVVFWAGLVLLFLAGLRLLVRTIHSRRAELTEDSVLGWKDAVQKGVRVSIGETRCLRETAPSQTGLLIEDDLRAYPHLGCVFYRLEFSLTMLPDPGSSVERGELSLELIPDDERAKLPFFVRLHPEEETVEEKKKLTRSGDGKATFKIPTIGEIEGGGKTEIESELQVETVLITSWGAGEQLGGWRFNASATRSIKTSITGLTALVAIPDGRKSKGRFRAAAHLRRARRSADLLVPEPEAFIEYEFPPTLEIPSTHFPVPEPVPAEP